MTTFTLQITAMITMLIDHMGGSFMNDFLPFRCIGRFAFIIYAFLFAEGFRHYRTNDDKIGRHLSFLVICTVISEICYDLLECDTFTITNLMSSQSAMITLLLAFFGLLAIEKWKTKPITAAFAILLTAMMSYIAKSNYKFMGVMLVYLFYTYLNYYERKPYVRRVIELMVIMIVYIPLYFWAYNDFCSPVVFFTRLTPYMRWFLGVQFLSPFILAAYNGKRGLHTSAFQLIYKWFYPAHLFILGVIYHLTLHKPY
ncbi:MAG: hypothetical protein IK152_03165 [Lachnospiraceae bacterium]|nr:hypothetical protein [Lachnospiraceae bacterium]